MTKKKIIIIISAILAVLAIVAGVIFLTQGLGSPKSAVEVEFNLNFDGAGAGPQSIRVKQGDTYGTLPEVADGTRPGYNFAGWYLSAACSGNPVDENTTVRKSINHRLYAKWVGKEYKVSFDLQGGNIHGETVIEDATVTCGKVYGVLAIPENPQREGHRFAGWYYDAEGTSSKVDGATKVIKTENHTLYAKWVEIIYNYTFDDPKHAEDFSTSEARVSWEIVNVDGDNKLKFTSPSESQEAKFIALNGELKAGTRVSLEVTFEGELPESSDRMFLFCYGLNEAKQPITAGKLDMSLSTQVSNWYNGNGIRAKKINGDMYLGDEGPGFTYKGDTTRISFTVMEDCKGICLWMLFGVPSNQSAIYLDNIKFTPYEGEFSIGGSTPTDATAFGYNVGASCFDLTEVERDGATVLKVTNNGNGRGNFLMFPKELKAGTQAKVTVSFEGDLWGTDQMFVFLYGAKENGDLITDGSLDKSNPANSNWYNGQGIRAKTINGEFYIGDEGTGYTKGNTVTIVANIRENCHGLYLWMNIPDGTNIYIHDLQFGTGFGPATGSAQTSLKTLGNYKYDSRAFNFRSTELNGEKVIKVTKGSGTTNSMPQYWTKLKAGDRVLIDVSFESTLGDKTSMCSFFYQMNADGCNIGEYNTGARAKMINGELKTGDGNIYTGKARRTFELVINQDCSGIVMLLDVPSGTTFYIHSIKVVGEGQGSEDVDPMLKDYVYWNSSYDFEVAQLGEEKVIKVTKGDIERNGMPQYWKELKAGQTVEIKVSYESTNGAATDMASFFYQMDANGCNIGEYNAGRRGKVVDGVLVTGDGNSYVAESTFTLKYAIQQDCSGIVMLLHAPEGTTIYIHSIEVVEADPFLENYVYSNSAFDFKAAQLNGEKVVKITKGDTPGVALPQYWKSLKAGQTVNIKLTYETNIGDATDIVAFFYQMDANGCNIGEYNTGRRGKVVNGVLVTGDGNNYVAESTFTLTYKIQQDCYGLVMLLNVPQGTAIYIHSIEVVDQEQAPALDDYDFNNTAFAANVVQQDGKDVVKITSAGTPGNTLPKFRKALKAGDQVKITLTYETNIGDATDIVAFFYQMDVYGNNIGEYNTGRRGKVVDGVLMTGDGNNYVAESTFTLDYTIQQDCYGLVMLLNVPQGTAIYIHSIELVEADPILENYDCANTAFEFNAVEYNGEKVVKITKGNTPGISLPRYWQDLKAGDQVKITLTYETTLGDATNIVAFFYQMNAAGNNIDEYNTGRRGKVVDGVLMTGDGNNYVAESTFTLDYTIQQDCHGLVMLLDVPEGTAIYIHSIDVN